MNDWQNPYIDSLTCPVRDPVVRKVKWKPLELPFANKNSKAKATIHSWKYYRHLYHHKRLEDAGVVIPTTFPFNYAICPIHKIDGSWRMTENYHKVNQVVTPIASAAPDVVSLLKQMSTYPDTWNADSDLANAFFFNIC